MRKKLLIITAIVIVSVMAFAGCSAYEIGSYTIPMIDLEEGVVWYGDIEREPFKFDATVKNDEEYSTMFNHKTTVTDKSDYGKEYMAHPDSILLRRKASGAETFEFTNEVLTVFPLGHGFGEVKGKISMDGGLTYSMDNELKNAPESWKRSTETPTIYRLVFNADNVSDENDKLILISGNPSWPADARFDRPKMSPNGFNVSMSSPSLDANGDTVEGREWTEFETWYGNGKDKNVDAKYVREPLGMFKAFDCIVAMSSLTRLKTVDAIGNKVWDNKWMGLFHDHAFNCYKTILSFETPTDADIQAGYPLYNIEGEDKVMKWSYPEKYFKAYRQTELKSNMCEVECVRSDGGQGDELMLITRSNSKKMNSLVTYSTDEGVTWSAPRETPYALSGERHKAEWVNVNGEQKLFITFRSIERGTKKTNKYMSGSPWMSEGYVAWVGSWDDIKSGAEGDFRVKLAHTYLSGDEAPSRNANGDTGYCGNVVLPDGRVATCSYGVFSAPDDKQLGGTTYILGKVIDVAKLYDLVAMAE